MRWTLISDGDHRTYLCPADRAAEATKTLEAIIEYWSSIDARVSMPDGPPEEPDFIIELEGEELTFESPQLDGVPVVGDR
jgi:hypothetical protein